MPGIAAPAPQANGQDFEAALSEMLGHLTALRQASKANGKPVSMGAGAGNALAPRGSGARMFSQPGRGHVLNTYEPPSLVSREIAGPGTLDPYDNAENRNFETAPAYALRTLEALGRQPGNALAGVLGKIFPRVAPAPVSQEDIAHSFAPGGLAQEATGVAPYLTGPGALLGAAYHMPQAGADIGTAAATHNSGDIIRAGISSAVPVLAMTGAGSEGAGALNVLARNAPRIGSSILGGSVAAGGTLAMLNDAEARTKGQAAKAVPSVPNGAKAAPAPADDLDAIAKQYKDDPNIQAQIGMIRAEKKDGSGPNTQKLQEHLQELLAKANAPHQDFAHWSPELAADWPLIQAAVPAALGGVLGLGKLGTSIGNRMAMNAAVRTGTRAMDAGDAVAASTQRTIVGNALSKYAGAGGTGPAARFVGDMGKNALAGSTVGGAIRAFPMAYNSQNAPEGSDARNAATLENIGGQYGQGALMGGVEAAAIGKTIPKVGLPIGKMKAFATRASPEGAKSVSEMAKIIEAEAAARGTTGAPKLALSDPEAKLLADQRLALLNKAGKFSPQEIAALRKSILARIVQEHGAQPTPSVAAPAPPVSPGRVGPSPAPMPPANPSPQIPIGSKQAPGGPPGRDVAVVNQLSLADKIETLVKLAKEEADAGGSVSQKTGAALLHAKGTPEMRKLLNAAIAKHWPAGAGLLAGVAGVGSAQYNPASDRFHGPDGRFNPSPASSQQ